eukprot:TRINITY_DN40223_c0_g1_i1.p1 TRINITY_DN40223_c0_g1~~TRINITY_DN40223_c0_g1_i1.p1  ORF type:complete len:232 (+),score=51.85 TRINITY_DN40223_c0_g1_i1:48-698(+)
MVVTIVKTAAVVSLVVLSGMLAFDFQMGEGWDCVADVPILCAQLPKKGSLEHVLADKVNSKAKWVAQLQVDYMLMLAYATLFGISPYMSLQRGNGFKSLICFVSYCAGIADAVENALLLLAVENTRGAPSNIPTTTLEPVIYGVASTKFVLLSLVVALHGFFWKGIELVLVPLGLVGLGTPLYPVCVLPCCVGFGLLSLSLFVHVFFRSSRRAKEE